MSKKSYLAPSSRRMVCVTVSLREDEKQFLKTQSAKGRRSISAYCREKLLADYEKYKI